MKESAILQTQRPGKIFFVNGT